MKTNNWLNLDHHQYVAIDLEDGRRIELEKNEKLILSPDSVSILNSVTGECTIFPAVKVSQILKKYRKRYVQ